MLLNPAAFSAPPSASWSGNTGRNAFRGPGAVQRGFVGGEIVCGAPFAGGHALTIRADAFNLLNHANLNNPDNLLGHRGLDLLRLAGRAQLRDFRPSRR